MKRFKNIVFDLGGVVFSRDPRKFEPEFIEFFSYVYLPKMPEFWEEYDRGAVSYDEMIEALMTYNKCDRELADKNVQRSIVTQEEVLSTKSLIQSLKAEGYRLYVLSNMSKEFIDFLRHKEVYSLFDGEVVSCEELCVKPEQEIYRRLESRYELNPSETLFIDDREANIVVARERGWEGYLFDHHNPEHSCKELSDMLLK
ncbi:MAG: HAD family phosphatase [Alistipes sp.]|nr:HAD family phosphatase [Alistipes sp.]MBQ8774841.1 HAD family phosphatase [Alistipes sp.]